MFSDESRFSLQSDSRRTFIWRAPGTRYHQENIFERHRYGGAWSNQHFLASPVPPIDCGTTGSAPLRAEAEVSILDRRQLGSSCGSRSHSCSKAVFNSEMIIEGEWRDEMSHSENPQTCCRIKVRRSGCPIHAVNIFIFQIIIDQLRPMWTVLSSINRKPGLTAPLKCRTQSAKFSSLYLVAVSKPLSSTCRSMRPSSILPAQTLTPPPP
ncbi:hypothetical protein X975_16652, partial [Stegodyphus mimosarum]